jgi:hypothetical protein
MMTEKARIFGSKLHIPETDFAYSKGWLARFKIRHNIACYKFHGESASADMTRVNAGRESLKAVIEEYSLNDVYNFDETGLFFKLGPSSTLATGPVCGKNLSKERITVGLAANATGTHKLTPVIVAHARRPRCFGKNFNPEIYCHYFYNKSAWMTAVVFTEWIQEVDKQMRTSKRNILMLLDNASSHKVDAELTNIRLHFLPPGTTAHIQPMDGGVIRTFKAYYRKHLIQHYLAKIENKEEANINLRECLGFVSAAWDQLKESTIANCWKHVKILPEEDTPDDVNLELEQKVFSEIEELVKKLQPEHEISVNEYIDLERKLNVPTCQELNDDEIINMIIDDDEDEEEPKVDDEPQAENVVKEISLSEAKVSIDNVLQYLEQRGGDDEVKDLVKCAWKIKNNFLKNTVIKQSSIKDFFN